MFQTKICGVTTLENATMLADVGVAAIGLNFYEKSKRYVTPERARKIVVGLPRCVKRVGVFVNASIDRILEIADIAQVDAVQLHGDEPPEFLEQLDGLRIIRAFRCEDGLEPVKQYLDRCVRTPDAVLVDAYDPHEYGGTGKSLHWPDIAHAADFVGDLPVILAGGLTPSNVAQAIKAARPSGVDVASGVEISPGLKDKEMCRQFVQAALTAFSA